MMEIVPEHKISEYRDDIIMVYPGGVTAREESLFNNTLSQTPMYGDMAQALAQFCEDVEIQLSPHVTFLALEVM